MGVAVLKLFPLVSDDIYWFLFFVTGIQSVAQAGLECSPGWPGTLIFLLIQPSEWALYLHTSIKQFYNEFEKELMLVLYSDMKLLTIDWMLPICKSENWKQIYSLNIFYYMYVWMYVCAHATSLPCVHMEISRLWTGSLFHPVGSWNWWGQSGGECPYLLSHLVHPKVLGGSTTA